MTAAGTAAVIRATKTDVTSIVILLSSRYWWQSQSIDWATSYGTGTLGSSTYITGGNARYIRWGNIVTLFLDEVNLPALSTGGSFTIFTGLPRAAEANVYFTIQSSAGASQIYRCAIRTDGNINRHYASNAASTQKLTGQITYICQS